jgi:hypothetical protein
MSPKRQLSEFLCRELLYDYAVGDLDNVRKEAVKESLEDYPELETELRSLTQGIQYLNQLKKTDISEPLFHRVTEEKGLWVTISKVSAWPSWIKWSLEAGAVALLLVLSIQIIPDEFWMKDTSHWQIGKVESEAEKEEIVLSDATDEEAVLTQKEEDIQSVKDDVVAVLPPEEPRDNSTAPTEKVDAKNPDKVLEKAEPTLVAVTPEPPKKPKATKGYVVRMSMYSDQVDKITPKIVEKINELGGDKAGEVKLGWRKKNGSYFHFMIPESKNSELTRFISQFGDVRISKDVHSRIMPEGTERYILWIEEVNAKPTDENEEDPEQNP